MEGHNNHTYIQDEINYDDLMNGSWPATNTDSQYNYQNAPQDPYNRFAADPSPYNNFDLSQAPSYPSISYSNSPYVPQYQNARPSDVFGQTSFTVDPSLSGPGPAYHGHENTFSFAPQALENQTIAPQSLQFIVAPNQNLNRATSNTFQQHQTTNMATFIQRPHDTQPTHTGMYYNNLPSGNTPINQGNIVRYSNMPNTSSGINPTPTVQRPTEEDDPSAPRPLQVKAMPTRDILRVTHPELLSTHSSVRPPFEYATYIHWEDKPVEITLGLKNTLPKYHPRKSRSGKELVPGLEMLRTSTPAGTSVKRGRPPKERKPLVSKYKGTSKAARPQGDKVSQLREDGTIVASPSTSTETSSSEEESTSEEESEYEEDEEEMKLMDIKEIRGADRPTNAADAAKWDVIGILWKDKASSPNAETVKDAIEKYGNFVSALRLKLKTNSTKSEAAAARPAELQALRDERRVLLDSLLKTIEAANNYGYLPIVENLGGHHKLVNGLTTTLIECVKSDDYTGRLPKAVFTLLAKFQTMTDDLLKKLKFDSIQKRWNKKGDDETKKLISEIVANTIDARERSTKSKKDGERADEEKKTKEKLDTAKIRVSQTSTPGSTTSTKRPHEGDALNGKPSKKFASDVGGNPAPISKLPAPKRPTGNLLGIASKPLSKPAKKRELSPPTESKLGALLASIEKPPEPPKAPTVPPRAPETPEQQAKRERKESRRHLRVKFREGSELEEIRLFKHEQVEDEGRQDEMLRDAHDDRSEGMMHKKRVAETIDDEEEYQPTPYEQPYPELVAIDFSSLDKQTRFGPSYTSRGGDLTFSTPEQKTQQRREEVELVAIYIDPSEIPPSAKEPPLDASREAQESELKLPSEPWFLQRLQIIDQYGPDSATQVLFNQRQHQKYRENQDQARLSQPFSGSAPPYTNVSSILQQLNQPAQQPTPQMPNHQQSILADWAEIERIVASLNGKHFPPVEPPAWMTNEAQRQIWWDGFCRDKAEKDRKELELRAAMDMQNARAAYQAPAPPVQVPQYQQQMPLPPPMPFPMPTPLMNHSNNPQQAPDITQQVQNLLAGYQNSDGAPPVQQFDYNSWANTNGQNDHNGYEQRGWEGDWDENANSNKTRAKAKQRGFASKPVIPESTLFDERGEYRGKKKPCRFYQEGKCVKGDKCTYLHDE